MTKVEKERLTALTRSALADIGNVHPWIRACAGRSAERFSPTNPEQYRIVAELVWCLIATGAITEAEKLLDTICEVDGNRYWMFHALASAFATRAWLNSSEPCARKSLSDAEAAYKWIMRDPNPRPVTEQEAVRNLARFDTWLECADKEKGNVTAVRGLSHALRVIVMYQQLAKADCAGAKAVPQSEYDSRIDSALSRIRSRFDAWFRVV